MSKYTPKDLIDEVKEEVEEAFEGYSDTLEELEDFVNPLAEKLMDTHNVDVDLDRVMKEVLKDISFPDPIAELCMECGDPDCPGCND